MFFIVMLYVISTIIIGYMSNKKNKTVTEFHGSNLGTWMCVAVGAGEWMGGTSTIGVSEYGYNWGISGAWYTIANGIGIMVCALFFSRLYRRMNTYTIPGIIGHFIGKGARLVSSVILICVMMAVGISQMIAVGTIGNVLFGFDMTVSIIVLGSIVIIYTIYGGMIAVGHTNTLHLIVMYVGMVIAVCVFNKSVCGVEQLVRTLPQSYFSFSSIGMPKINSWVIASALGACTAQAGIQPILVAKNEKVALRSSVIIACIVAPFGLLTAYMGMIAKVRFPTLASAKLALPMLMLNLPEWVSGMILAAVIAAILSTASPIFLSCGTLFVKDILLMRVHKMEKSELIVSKIVTAISGVICMIGAVALIDCSVVLDIVYFAYSLRGSLFVVLLFGILSKRGKVREQSAILSMIISSIVGLGWVVSKSITGRYPLGESFSEVYATIFAAIISMCVFKIIGAINKKDN